MAEVWLTFSALLFMALAMNLAWLFQRGVGNSGWIDVFWTFATGLAGAGVALWPLPGAPFPTERQLLVAVLVAVWAIRLGSYIAVRVASSAEDARYVAFRKRWGPAYQWKLLWVLQPQAVVSAILCLSILLAARRPDPGLGLQDFAGVIVLAIALIGEAIADLQLARFKAKAAPGAICDRGLWAWSRHPNYFFEWLGWLAYPAIAIDPARPISFLSLAAPAVMFVVLRFVTGVPPLEKAMLASRGERFRAYQARTSVFIPLPPRRPKDTQGVTA